MLEVQTGAGWQRSFCSLGSGICVSGVCVVGDRQGRRVGEESVRAMGEREGDVLVLKSMPRIRKETPRSARPCDPGAMFSWSLSGQARPLVCSPWPRAHTGPRDGRAEVWASGPSKSRGQVHSERPSSVHTK